MPTIKIKCDLCSLPMRVILKTNTSKKYHCSLCDFSKLLIMGERARQIKEAKDMRNI